MTAAYVELLDSREVAGLRTEDGGRLRPGLLYRSGTPQFLDLPTGPAPGRAHRHPVDRRPPLAARGPMPGDDPIVQTYLRYLDDGADEIVGVLPGLLRPGMLPTLVHRTVGKDRTGVVVALLLAAVGVRRDDIVADHAAGAADVTPAVGRLRGMASYGDAVDVHPPATWVVEAEAMRRLLETVDERHGGVRPYLHAHGVPPAIVEELTGLLVEHPSDPRAGEELL